MKSFVFIVATLLATSEATTAASADLTEIAGRMSAIDCYKADCTYEVLLASLSQPVTYTVSLESSAASADTLAPCHYIIRWSLPAAADTTSGFSAYFDGTHFRFRDKRLQEYHSEWSAQSFAPGGDTWRGVQCQAQFCELLPQFMAARFREMAADTSYIYTVKTVNDAVVIDGVRLFGGYDGAEYTYTLDAATLLPRRIELENNPGQIGEQSIAVTYSSQPAKPSGCTIAMATLTATESEAFEKYRESSFTLESLPGRMLPEIAAPTTTGERYMHVRGDGFAAPTVLVFLESSVGSTADVVRAVREAIAMLPMQVDVIWAFLDHRADDVEAVIERPMPGEHLLMHATRAARDCGVGTSTPAIVFVNADGKVSDFINGYNQDLLPLVIQKASLLKSL